MDKTSAASVLNKSRNDFWEIVEHVRGTLSDPDRKLSLTEATWEGLMSNFAVLSLRCVSLQQRVAELEARPQLDYRGIWTEGVDYVPGNLVTHRGTIWFCREATSAQPGGPDWQLMVKTAGRPT